MARLPIEYCRMSVRNATTAVFALKKILDESQMCVLSDALQCFANNPDWHSCDEDLDEAAILALAFDIAGYNHTKPEFDILQKWDFPKNDEDEDVRMDKAAIIAHSEQSQDGKET